jgi:hypothetical protein
MIAEAELTRVSEPPIESRAISKVQPTSEPSQNIMTIGKAFAESGMFGCKTVPQGIVLALHCHYEQISPVRVLQTYHLIEGHLTMRADAMLAAFRKAGGEFTWIKDGKDGQSAAIKLKFAGNEYVSEFTFADAEKALLVKKDKPNSNWMKTPANMLRARAVSDGVRMLAPEVVCGIYTPEEMGDYEPETVIAAVATTKRGTKSTPVTAAPTAQPEVIDVIETKPAEPPTVDVAATPAANPVATPSPSESDEIIDKVALLKKDLGIVSDLSWDAIVEQQGIPVEAASGKRKLRGGTIEQQRGLLAHLVTLNEIRQSVEKLGIADDKWPKVLAKFEIVPVTAHHLCWLSATPTQAATLGHFLTASIAEREKKRTATA